LAKPPLLPPRSRQGRGGAGRPWSGGGRRPPGAGGDRGKGGKEAEGEGFSLPSSPLARIARGGGSAAQTERGAGARGGGAVELGEDLWMLDCGAVQRGRVVLAFYRRPKAVRGEDISGGRPPVSSRVFSKSGRTPRRPATRQLEQRRVNTCREGLGRPWRQRRQPASVCPTRRLGVMATGRVPAGTSDPSWRGPAVA
jgi:hypothetical protein